VGPGRVRVLDAVRVRVSGGAALCLVMNTVEK
jgi:hypothetical protein